MNDSIAVVAIRTFGAVRSAVFTPVRSTGSAMLASRFAARHEKTVADCA
jgi:hypothetical protein